MNKKVLLLVSQGVELYEFAAFYDVFGWAREEAELPVELVCAGVRKEVCSAFSLQLLLDHRITIAVGLLGPARGRAYHDDESN